jgi:hypothetical protein
MDDRKRAKFIRGLLLAWLPCVFFLFRNFSRWIPEGGPDIGTGIAGSPPMYAIPILPCEVAALFFLLRSFSRRHPLRTFFSGITALWSVALIAVLTTAVLSAINAAF